MVALMGFGLPVAFGFLAINIVGASATGIVTVVEAPLNEERAGIRA